LRVTLKAMVKTSVAPCKDTEVSSPVKKSLLEPRKDDTVFLVFVLTQIVESIIEVGRAGRSQS
jgi:hypothetical protein